jgi:phosphoglycolate phosphatase-like HAD superfamily hydrolase
MTLPTAVRPDASSFQPPPHAHDTLIGIDSDGCVFDSMGVKQRNHFVPFIIRWWGLEAVAPIVRRHIEHINLFSPTRGGNRFPNLILLFEALAREPALQQRGIALPDLTALRRYCASGQPLGNATLEREAARTRDSELLRVLDWSRALSHDIDTRMEPVPPFAWARRSLERIARGSDRVVISQTPEVALRREWQQHGLDRLVPCLAGQEQGSKAQQLQRANGGRYAPARVLMIGDARGDQVAAEACGALFYPILPGQEEAAWRLFHDEAYDRFLAGTYAGAYADELLQRFHEILAGSIPVMFP